MPSTIKTSSTFFAVGCTEKQILHIIYLFVQDLIKGLGWGKIPFSFWHNILEPHFILSLQCSGMLFIHSFHMSCLRYFLCSFIRLSNNLMVFQLHSAAVQRAGSVTGNIWCNLCVDKWEAGFPGCKAYGRNSVWAGPVRAPFFGCQVAQCQDCGGAEESAPSNWNVDWSAGTALSLSLSQKYTLIHIYVHEHSRWMKHFLLCFQLNQNDQLIFPWGKFRNMKYNCKESG